jgi:hypothetical protein
MIDWTGKDARGRAIFDCRKNGKFRLRCSHLHEDQRELIDLALKKSRKESDTTYDAVALTNICMAYLCSG